MKHTAGPWSFDGTKITDTEGKLLHNSDRTDEERVYNAKLIAAAPELLATLSDITHMCELSIDNFNAIGADVVERARLAIDKATI